MKGPSPNCARHRAPGNTGWFAAAGAPALATIAIAVPGLAVVTGLAAPGTWIGRSLWSARRRREAADFITRTERSLDNEIERTVERLADTARLAERGMADAEEAHRDLLALLP